MTPEDVLAGLEAPLSARKRFGYVAVGLAGLTGSALIGLLWATEPGLPTRTRVAFAVLIGIGLAWAGFGAWAVSRRVPLFARDRVVAAWLGVAAWSLFTGGGCVIALLRHRVEPGFVATALALAALAAVNLRAARRARAELLRRRAQLS